MMHVSCRTYMSQGPPGLRGEPGLTGPPGGQQTDRHADTLAHARMHTHTHTNTRMHTCMHTHTCTHAHTHTRTHTHTHTHTGYISHSANFLPVFDHICNQQIRILPTITLEFRKSGKSRYEGRGEGGAHRVHTNMYCVVCAVWHHSLIM